MQEDLLDFAIKRIENSDKTFLKFLTANDTGANQSHQSGIYIPKNASSILFDHPGRKGQNFDKFVNIKWMNQYSTESRFIYYGKETRDEYRITRFGYGFPYLKPENTGA